MSSSTETLRRYAYHLMSLASLGQFMLVIAALLIATALAEGVPIVAYFTNARWEAWAADVRPVTHGYAFAFILMTWAPITLGQMWVLLQLRRLASSLYRQETLSSEVAMRFKSLADALPMSIVLAGFGPTLISGLLGLSVPPLALEFGGLYVGAIAFLALRAVAMLIAQAAAVADENRGFV